MPALPKIGAWRPTVESPHFKMTDIAAAARRCRETAYVIQDELSGSIGIGFGGEQSTEGQYRLLAVLPPLFPEWLGDRSFTEQHALRFPYVAGAMANGIATVELVVAMAKSGCLGFFGAAGLDIHVVEKAVDRLKSELEPLGLPWGSNLIHSPNEPDLEQSVVDLYLRKSVRKVSAAAYMKLTLPLVQYAATGLSRDDKGRIVRLNSVFAKVSRPEVARHFMSPPPAAMLHTLVEQGAISPEEAELAALLPLAEDFSVEADSGGHTDNQSATSLFPTLQRLRDEISTANGYDRPIRLGLAGGIGTPEAVAAAFSMGAAYVLTGSINQSCIESGLHDDGKALLAKAELADVVMAPAADMFELGVDVQVLKRGTMFGVRAKKLYALYRQFSSLDEIPSKERQNLERSIFLEPIDSAWRSTEAYWQQRDPREAIRASKEPKHKMALLFRSYLGQSSKWAILGDKTRKMDYQIWCGPAMGAFNVWAKNTFLAIPKNRKAAIVALNLLEGAATICRAQQLRSCGAPVPQSAFAFQPRRLQV